MSDQATSHKQWLECKAAVGPDQQICCVYNGPQPLYFIAPADAGDEELDLRSFEVRNGRPMSDDELTIRAMHKQKSFAAFDPWAGFANA